MLNALEYIDHNMISFTESSFFECLAMTQG